MKSICLLGDFVKLVICYHIFINEYFMTASKLKIEIELRDYCWKNVCPVQKFFREVFPVEYEFDYFVDMIYGDLVKLVFHGEEMIGILYSYTDETDLNVFVIASIGCLPKYRRLGIGRYLLEYALDYVAEKGKHKVIRLYVQTSNKPAIEFYKKYGFEIIVEEPDYYFQFLDKAAYKMEKVIRSEINHSSSN